MREDKRLSVRQLAAKSGVSHPYLSQIENAKNGIASPSIIRKLAKGLQCDYETLMTAAEYVESDYDYPVNELRALDKIAETLGMTTEQLVIKVLCNPREGI